MIQTIKSIRHFQVCCLMLFGVTPFVGCGNQTAARTTTPPIATLEQPLNAAALDDAKPAEQKPNVPETVTAQPEKQTTVEAKPAAEKPKRAAIYNPDIPGPKLIADAIRKAQRDHKHVLIEWGGNWCGWCHLLHDLFEKNPDVHRIVYEEFELVLVDSNTNQELLAEYGGKDKQFSYPHLTVLDETGKVLTNQNTEPLEQGKGHSPEAVLEFLNRWKPAKLDAETYLSEKLKMAREQNKRVFLQVGSPYCGWCKVLSQFLQDHQELLAQDYVHVKLDTLRMTNGTETAARYLPEEKQGIPWFLILDGEGKSLASSIGPKGNIGYPFQPDEIAHFMTILRTTRQSLTDKDLELVNADLNRFRMEREKK